MLVFQKIPMNFSEQNQGIYQVIHINLDIQLMCSQIQYSNCNNYKKVVQRKKNKEKGEKFLREYEVWEYYVMLIFKKM